VTTARHRGKRIHDTIRREILNGAWRPGERLQPGDLADRYSTSTTVVREALTRLAGEGFVSLVPNRGFFVPTLSLESLRDLTEVRCRTEALAIELALERGDVAWESALIASHHTLSRTPRRNPDDPYHTSEEWADAHREFHNQLISACRVPVLTELSSKLADATELHRRWAAPSPPASTRDVEAEHTAILEAALARDAALAGALLREHYERTVQIVLESGLADGAHAKVDITGDDSE